MDNKNDNLIKMPVSTDTLMWHHFCPQEQSFIGTVLHHECNWCGATQEGSSLKTDTNSRLTNQAHQLQTSMDDMLLSLEENIHQVIEDYFDVSKNISLDESEKAKDIFQNASFYKNIEDACNQVRAQRELLEDKITVKARVLNYENPNKKYSLKEILEIIHSKK